MFRKVSEKRAEWNIMECYCRFCNLRIENFLFFFSPGIDVFGLAIRGED